MAVSFLFSLYSWTAIAAFTIILGILAVITSFFSANASRKIAKLWGGLILKACRVKAVLPVVIKGTVNILRKKALPSTRVKR
ncbi:MAG: hypothetical protein M1467_03540 [Deltaproteobacteria bacterium]|nr:hypothetical protein [Deltaproteobacteria bacterium]